MPSSMLAPSSTLTKDMPLTNTDMVGRGIPVALTPTIEKYVALDVTTSASKQQWLKDWIGRIKARGTVILPGFDVMLFNIFLIQWTRVMKLILWVVLQLSPLGLTFRALLLWHLNLSTEMFS